MSEVTRTGSYSVSAAQLWELVADFGGIDKYMDGVDACECEGEGVGALRTIPAGKVPIIERLDAFDPTGMSLTYSIVQGEVPFKDYSATMVVSEDTPDSSTLTWTGTFEPDGVPADTAERFAAGIYKGGMAGYRKALGLS